MNDEAHTPLYASLRHVLEQCLAGGEWRPGDTLPADALLARRFRVSVGTVRRAVDALVESGALIRRPGQGTVVLEREPNRLLYFFHHIVRRDGVKERPEIELAEFAGTRADAVLARQLNLLPGDPVWRMVNIERLGGVAVMVDEIHVAQARFPDLSERIVRERDNTLYRLYQSRYGINVVRASEKLSVGRADAPTAARLSIPEGTPVLDIERIALTFHGAPVESRRSRVHTADHVYWNDLGKGSGEDYPG